MHIKILGHHIFQKGGTSRSNLNLIQALVEAGHEVTYVNYVGFRNSHLKSLISNVGTFLKQVQFVHFKGLSSILNADMLILTREDFFHLAREVKYYQNNIVILGEVHGPLHLIKADQDLGLDAMDAIRVSTLDIAKAFQKQFDYPYVFPMYVNTSHISLHPEPKPNTKNLLIKARFEDAIKDISYAIQLMKYIVHTRLENDVHLYLEGYGPSLSLYERLIDYYQLQDHVHINKPSPKSYIYISVSNYETLGYSILEAIGSGNRVAIFPGNDDVLQSIYRHFNGVSWLDKEYEADYKVLKEIFDHPYTQDERQADITQFQEQFSTENYAQQLIQQTFLMSGQHNTNVLVKPKPKARRYYYTGVSKRSITRSKRLLSLIPKPSIKSVKGYQKVRRNIFKIESKFKDHQNRKRNVSPHHIFIESFHGKNFSGDPKYIALAFQRLYPDARIYVSAVNDLVDMEIRRHHMVPIRFGSKAYIKAFEQCKYVVVNGNLWDRLVKHPEQQVIQTWHGFPLKRMVYDLNDKVERQKQSEAFFPRMLKWDIVLSSSAFYEKLITSAFNLKQHLSLNIWREGAPRNSVLYQVNDEKRMTIQEKYLFKKDSTKHYILFCPTWRQNKRERISKLDLIALIETLPEHYELIVKLHPNESHMQEIYQNMHPRIHCFDNSLVDIQELYLIADVLITDYSSAIFDYAHLNRLILVLEEDISNYNQSVGFYFDIEKLDSITRVHPDASMIATRILEKQHVQHDMIIQEFMQYDHPQSDEKVVKRLMTQDIQRGGL
ncbi:CDP-glycerol glycerophosphotransferase family protein [Staphylococcus canis]|uniref:CDP-glycerol--glycerophosphate glycerophosphotransferase n=1 Tax=Staphylococcus canis TaxID=2724942 RepID=A0ABS0T8D2_9STAP|nr:CDP-glycerol glycerophosphotransferase family protein [Staphylococcus canis]MBI5974014.1 CDP-glycerol--glycerophosphate glycerophosphotransferase [Staphylococcus canis]